MRDSKPMEHAALTIVVHKLIRFGFSCSEPFFDVDGGDLFVYIDERNTANAVKVQSKGRDISQGPSNVEIYRNYVSEDFVCCLFVETEDVDKEYVYIFFHDDIINWNLKKGKDVFHDKYVLSVGTNFPTDPKNAAYLFDSKRAQKLKDLFKDISITHTSLNIDQWDMLCSFFEMWCKYNICPDTNALKIIDKEIESNYYNEPLHLFVACMYIKLENDGDLYGIDWFMEYMRQFPLINELDLSLIIPQGKSYNSNYGITYRSTVDDIVYNDGQNVNGFHLHIGDKEEQYDAYLLRDGRYGVVKTK